MPRHLAKVCSRGAAIDMPRNCGALPSTGCSNNVLVVQRLSSTRVRPFHGSTATRQQRRYHDYCEHPASAHCHHVFLKGQEPNNQGERREAAAGDVEFVSERNGCPPFARPCALGLAASPKL